MSQNFNVEEVNKIKQAVASIEEVIPTGRVGIENAVEIARESEAVKYIKSAENLQAGAEAFFKVVGEYKDLTEELANTYARLDAGLNG